MNEPISPAMPDPFDRQLATLHRLPDVVHTKASTLRTIPPLGIGGTQMWIVQTYRQRDEQKTTDTIFLETVSMGGTVRLVIPDAVAAVIARQRDALTTKTRSRAAKTRAEELKAQGIAPGFLRKTS